MKVFPREIIDGLGEVIKAQASVAYCAPAVLTKDVVNRHDFSGEFLDKIKASSNPNQIDLYYLKSVLVSTGWNKNDDVFDANATWAARNTPEDKQFNFMHDENDIIGHITGSYVVDRQGNRIPSDSTEVPADFDIITEAVLYNSWTSPANQERMQQIIAEIEEGKWFVSMECLFAGFDYALADTQGQVKIVARGEESAFLTKHLRAYGGTGEYEGYKVGRVLREISFSGKGLVERPANPRSIILDTSIASLKSNESNASSVPTGDNNMSDTNHEKQLAAIQAELDTVKAGAATASAEFAEKISVLESTLAERETAIKSFEDKVASLEAALAAKETEFTELKASYDEMKKSEKNRSRKEKLVKAGFEDAEAEESLANYDALSDEAFESVVAAFAKKFGAIKSQASQTPPAGEAGPAPKTEPETPASDPEGEADAATAGVFNGTESSDVPPVTPSGDEDELEATRASVASWLSESVLGSK